MTLKLADTLRQVDTVFPDFDRHLFCFSVFSLMIKTLSVLSMHDLLQLVRQSAGSYRQMIGYRQLNASLLRKILL